MVVSPVRQISGDCYGKHNVHTQDYLNNTFGTDKDARSNDGADDDGDAADKADLGLESDDLDDGVVIELFAADSRPVVCGGGAV